MTREFATPEEIAQHKISNLTDPAQTVGDPNGFDPNDPQLTVPELNDVVCGVREEGSFDDKCRIVDPSTVPATTVPTTTTVTSTTGVATTSTTTPTTVAACSFVGFFAPVDNTPTINVVNAGAAVPVKFGFCTSGSLTIFAVGSPSSSQHTCGSAASDPIEETVTASTSGLSFANGRYQYNWKTDKAWVGQCRKLQLSFATGITASAEFRFK